MDNEVNYQGTGDEFDFGEDPDMATNARGDPSLALDPSLAQPEFSFSPEDVQDAVNLADVPPGTRMLEAFRRTKLGVYTPESFAEWYAHWTVAEFIRFCCDMTKYGGHTAVDSPMGDLTYTVIDKLVSASDKALRLSLVQDKNVVSVEFTDLTLPKVIYAMRGIRVGPLVDKRVSIIVPEICEVVIGTEGLEAGRVISGGHAFVESHNAAYKTHYSYTQSSPDARAHALLWCSLFTISKRGDRNIEFTTLALPGNASMRKAYGEVGPDARSYIKDMSKLLQGVYANPQNRPHFGHKRENQRAYIEALLTKGHDRLNARGKVGVQRLTQLLAEGVQKRLVGFLAPFHPLSARPVFYEILSGHRASVPGVSKPFKLLGDVLGFVASSRKFIRDEVDLSRKSDAWGQGPLGSAVSVPLKTLRNIQSLFLIGGGDASLPVDAWGTDRMNWWHYAVLDSFPNAHFYDIDKAFIPPLGGKFDRADIDDIPSGSKTGMVILDDTFNAPKNDPDSAQTDAKVASVIGAGYQSGYLKMYLGSGTEGICQIGKAPPSLMHIVRNYSNVLLLPGDSPHSPEYFVCFSDPIVPGASEEVYFSPPKLDESKRFLPPGPQVKQPVGMRVPEYEKYVKTWITMKVRDMLVSNVRINAQVVGAAQISGRLDTWLVPPAVDSIRLAGSGATNSQAVDSGVDSVDPEDTVM
jgi:hypothetical protein